MHGLPHPLSYAWEIWQNLMMPPPQHPYPARIKAARACRIAGAPWRGVVVGSIDRHCQSHCGARAIQHGSFPPSQPPPAGGRCRRPRFLRRS